MNNQTQPDKATPRPWSYREAFDNGEPCGYVVQSGAQAIADVPQSEDDASLIVTAVNEREALEAVAEAAKRFRLCHQIIVEILAKFGAATRLFDIDDCEFESSGCFGRLAKAAGIESPGAKALINNWNGWSHCVDVVCEMFVQFLDESITELATIRSQKVEGGK